MDFPGDISTLRIGDKIRIILPVGGFFKPDIGKEYSLGQTSGRGQVISIRSLCLHDIAYADLEGMHLMPIVVIKDGTKERLSPMQCFKRYWDNRYRGKLAWEKNPSVLIVDMECIKSLHGWYNDQTGFYDYAEYYGQLDAFGKSEPD